MLLMFEHRRAAAAHKLHESEIALAAECDHALNRVGGFKRDVKKDDIGRAAAQRRAKGLAVGEFLGFDSGAMEDERQEVAYARIPVDDEAEGCARLAVVFLASRRAGRR